ncbi:hypothetical protein [Streptomyces sp. XH2]|uniref:hypothetical protein n=1 Tax=Streptomyces sp. XH2 TaxID=3412483 RepID=UPI003C7DA304
MATNLDPAEEMRAALAITKIGIDRLLALATDSVAIGPHAEALRLIHDQDDETNGLLHQVHTLLDTIALSLEESEDPAAQKAVEELHAGAHHVRHSAGRCISRARALLTQASALPGAASDRRSRHHQSRPPPTRRPEACGPQGEPRTEHGGRQTLTIESLTVAHNALHPCIREARRTCPGRTPPEESA